MSENYKVVKVFLETVSYSLLIFKIPDAEINDKLTYLTREKGLIAKSLYDDFLIATFVSNINPFLQHLRAKGTVREQLNEVRAEIVNKVLEINPKLIPSNLVINTNHVVKLKEGSKKETEKLLSENDFWTKDVYKDTLRSSKTGPDKKLDKSVVKNIKDLGFILIQRFWRRIGQYINVKQFEPGSELVILADRSFNTRTSFEQYVITICIEEIEDLFMRLDKIGLPTRVASPILIHELYEICRKANPFLDFDVYRDTFGNDMSPEEEYPDNVDPFESFQSAAQNTMEDILSESLKKKKIKVFREVDKKSLLNLGSRMKTKVIGQNEPINDLVNAIQRASVGLKDPEQPIGSFIFTGYTGVGKTYTAKILAEELIGSRHGVVTVDCSEYSADHEYAKLIGAPSGYIGHEQGGYLTNAVRKNPFSVILFDEVEKASEKVHQLMLQIMDSARLTDGKGSSVSFKDTIVIMTSNLGVDEIQKISKTIGFGDVAKLTKDKRVDAVKEALKSKFKPEFLNRITCMVNFDALSKKDFLKIIKLEIEKLKRNLKLNRTEYSKLNIKFDKSLYNYIYQAGIDEQFGARPLKRAIEQKISTPLAKKLLKENIDCSSAEISVFVEKDELMIDVINKIKIDNPPFYMESGARQG
jgi:ATP-dependent Clp protease ATP-binding subunit ClpA